MEETKKAEKTTNAGKKFVDLFCTYGLYFIFVVMIIFFTIQKPNFFSLQNLFLILKSSSVLGLAVVGMFFVLIVAGIDISVSMNMYFSAVVGATVLNQLHAPLIVCFLASLACGALIGCINGAFVSKVKVAPFIVTLATYSVAKGLGLFFTNQQMVFLDSSVMNFANIKIGGISIFVFIFLAVVLIAHYVLTSTQFGRQLFACGCNLVGANKMGINGPKVIFLAYIICGALSGLAGMLSACNLSIINPNFAQGDEFVVISSAVIGGASLFGGKGKVLPGAIVGIVMIQAIINGLTMMGASAYSYTIFRGIIIFIAVMVDSIKFSGEIR